MSKLMALVAAGMFGLGSSIVFADDAATSDQPTKKEMKEKGKGERHGGAGDEMGGPGDRGPGRGGPGGDNMRMMNDLLLMKYPKEMEEIKKLRESDPEAAKSKMQELAKKAGEEMKAEREKFMELVKTYQKDKDPKVLEQIKAKVTEQYTQRLENMKKKIEFDENNIKERKAKYDEAKVDAEEYMPQKFVVDSAFKAEKKTTPVRWLIVLVSSFSAFMLSILVLIFIENIYKKSILKS